MLVSSPAQAQGGQVKKITRSSKGDRSIELKLWEGNLSAHAAVVPSTIFSVIGQSLLELARKDTNMSYKGHVIQNPFWANA